jgi:7-cyano-7-deazaguanine reductase
MQDLAALLQPKYLEVWGRFAPRGGISIYPYANYGQPGKWAAVAQNRLAYRDMGGFAFNFSQGG